MITTLILLATLSGSNAAASTPTFNKDIAPILYQNCVTCHRPGEVAPFSLMTYRDAKRWAPMIATATTNHVMPPWKATPGFGDFADARVLPESDIVALRNWAEAGAPEGKGEPPKTPVFIEGWSLGTPDKVIE